MIFITVIRWDGRSTASRRRSASISARIRRNLRESSTVRMNSANPNVNGPARSLLLQPVPRVLLLVTSVCSVLIMSVSAVYSERAAAVAIPCASAESMDGLMAAWTRDFSNAHPDTPARVTRKGRFSADFVDALGRGEVKVAPFARELFPSERTRIAELAGGPPLVIPVATGSRATKGGTHAIVMLVNTRNPIGRLSLTQLQQIFSRDGSIATWGQVGLGGEWTTR